METKLNGWQASLVLGVVFVIGCVIASSGAFNEVPTGFTAEEIKDTTIVVPVIPVDTVEAAQPEEEYLTGDMVYLQLMRKASEYGGYED